MILLLRKKNIGFFFTGLFFLFLSFGIYNFALHPNMYKWKKEKIVITDVKTDEKAVSLTFDDGPDSRNTALLLDTLKKHSTRATFFVTGINAEKNPFLLQRMRHEGHEIGNHSYSHADFNYKSTEFILDEIVKTNDIIFRITGQRPTLFRPPGGYLSYDMVDLVRKENLTIAYWTYQQDSKDWRGIKASQIANHIIRNIKPGQIIILHDGGPNGMETVKAVDMLIPELTKQGYRFLTVSELIKLENKE